MSVTVRVFDPAMCCSTGICGPSVDPALVRFAADLAWLKSQGVSVERYTLSQQPAAFAADAEVKAALEAKGEAALPLVKVEDEVKSSGGFPTRAELASWSGLPAPTPSLFTAAVAELVAIGAAIATNCEPSFKVHYAKARKLGVSREDMLLAVATAQNIKDIKNKVMSDLAERHLRREAVETPAETAATTTTKPNAGCCGPSASASSTSGATPGKKSSCC